jgi:hypothetical protein
MDIVLALVFITLVLALMPRARFFVIVGLLMERTSLAAAFASATAVTLVVQLAVLWALKGGSFSRR